MFERPLVRLCLILCCLGVVGCAMVDYAGNERAQSAYPTDGELESSFESSHGEQVHLWVDVVAANESGFTGLYGDYGLVRVTERPAAVAVGDTVQVYGTARPDDRIDPDRIVVSNQRGVTYMLVISALAVVLTLTLTVSRWQFQPRKLRFVPRGGDDE
ncbi:hypothetical protein [Haloarchaeobius sp. DFWS5]|uniref:hypothetical protein n=1 Tax=Haloarchaeobius sp. DFWS5 TaxID=3446114 RepID=UPI003EBE3838